LKGGSVITDEIAVADAHPLGARPFAREQYIAKFRSLADGVIAPAEQDRFLALVARLPELQAQELGGLTFTVDAARLGAHKSSGIFDWHGASARRSDAAE
jgi:2-methylcitrate dehydratase